MDILSKEHYQFDKNTQKLIKLGKKPGKLGKTQ